MSVSALEAFRNRSFLRGVAAATLCFFSFVFYSPSALAVKLKVNSPRMQQHTADHDLPSVMKSLRAEVKLHRKTLREHLQKNAGTLERFSRWVGLAQDRADMEPIENLFAGLEERQLQALGDLDQVEQHLIEKQLPESIRKRHAKAVERAHNEFNKLKAQADQLQSADSLEQQEAALKQLEQSLDEQKLERSHQYTDPNNLPWGTPDASKTREPAEITEELSRLSGVPSYAQPILLAANTITPEMLGQPGGPVAEDLAETVDVQLTEAIRAKALELGEDPVRIYNWVRNNIEFIPSYGSIQGADYTLQHGKGNAFDTASLLIALLRAANIPARYAYGTVQIPADQVMNWVGGVEVPGAAQQLLGQGGIPNTGLVQGGKITHIKMEHIWVESWVDFEPSRAAKHRVGDSWIPLDASFKQYEYTEGEDLQNQVPFNAQGLLDQINASASIDESEGWVQDVNQADVESALTQYQQQIEDYINAQNPEATVGDVLGTQKVIIREQQQLSAGLPYQLIARTHNYSALPSSQRHKFRYTLGTEYYGMESSRLITFEKSLPELAGKQLALSFKPATEDDEEIINSYIPEPDPETGEIDPSQLPRTLPGYLINLTAEFTEDGEVVDSASAGTMGTELYETLALWAPGRGWQQAVNHPVAGEYRAIGLDPQGISPEQATRLQESVEQTKAKLESEDDTQIATLTKHQLVGDLMYGTIFSYFALNDVQDQIQAQSSNIVTYRLPSYGIFSTGVQTQYWFGMPRNVSFDGLNMDVDHLVVQVSAKNNDPQARLGYVQASGVRASAMEHLVPEQMFSTPEAPAQGISAVKALSIASAEGQKIWTITQSNLDAALSSIQLDAETETEIRQSVLAGKVATAHELPINLNDWVGEGYLLVDPRTGAGAYKIAGGANGGTLYTAIRGLVEIMGLVSVNNALLRGASLRLIPLVVASPIGVAFTAILGIIVVMLAIMYAVSDDGNNCSENCPGVNFMDSMSALALVGILATLAFGGIAALLTLFIMVAMLIRFMMAGLL